MTEETIRLSVHVNDNGYCYLTDQHGRRLQGVQELQLNFAHDDITTVSVKALAYDDKGSPYSNRQKRGVSDE